MTKTLLLWDIDGTLLNTGGAGMTAMRKTCLQLFGSDFQWGEVETAGMLDPLIFADLAKINNLRVDQQQHDAFHDRYIVELERQLELQPDKVKVMRGVLPLLQTLRQRAASNGQGDLLLGLLTGNYSKAVPLKLTAVGIDVNWFSVTAFGDDGPTRPDLLALALRKYQLLNGHEADPSRVIVIGDTPRDVACAHAHQCIAFAVATGSHTVSMLRAAGADEVVKDLSDPSPLVALLDR